MLARAVSALTVFLLWFAFAGSLSLGEIVSAVIVTGLALAAYQALRSHVDVPSSPTLRWMAEAAWQWPARILRDALSVCRAVLRDPDELGHVRRFRVPDSADESAVAWAMIGTSISPNAYTIGWDPDPRVLVLHMLTPSRRATEELVWWPR